MKEIKFRAWDKIRKEMSYSNEGEEFTERIRCFFNKQGNMIAVKIKEGKEIDMKIMQFIGLKDKNRKEIFEGDIVQDEDIRCQVIFRDGSFIPVDVFSKKHLDEWEECDFEVIGNIYENPELLEEGK